MRIWWCQEHEMAALKGSQSYCAKTHYVPAWYPEPCRLVPMRLIPDNAETIERIAATLKEVALAKINNGLIANPYPSIAVAILAALDAET